MAHLTPATPVALRRGRTLRFTAAALLAGTLALTACGDDGDSSATSEAATATTEEGHEVVDDATVTAGLTATKAEVLAAAMAGKLDDAGYEEIFEGWEAYEGTVKKNDVNTYLALEDAFAALKKAGAASDTAGMKKAADAIVAAADAYLAKHP